MLQVDRSAIGTQFRAWYSQSLAENLGIPEEEALATQLSTDHGVKRIQLKRVIGVDVAPASEEGASTPPPTPEEKAEENSVNCWNL